MDLIINDIDVTLTQKKIKHIYLRVHQTTGAVYVSAPHSMSVELIRLFVRSRLDWILKKQHQQRLRVQALPNDYRTGDRVVLYGTSYEICVIESKALPTVVISGSALHLYVRPGTDREKRHGMIESWYRQQLTEQLNRLLPQWEKIMRVSVARYSIRCMKTRWGSCSPATRTIRFNLELVKKPLFCLEYIVVHELAHLLEPSHNKRFVAMMDAYLPEWRRCREALKRAVSTDCH